MDVEDVSDKEPDLWPCRVALCMCFLRLTNEPHQEKTCLKGFRPGKTQTGLQVAKDPKLLSMHRKDSDQIMKIHRVIRVFAGLSWFWWLCYALVQTRLIRQASAQADLSLSSVHIWLSRFCFSPSHFQFGPRQANLCLRAFRHDKFHLRMPSHSEGQGSGFLAEGSSWFTACICEQRRFWRDCASRLAWTFAARIGDKYQICLTWSIYCSVLMLV